MATPLLLPALCAPMVAAQVKGFTPVEQTVGDLGPLSRSLRLAPMDLRTPMEFDRVYRVPGSNRGIGVPGSIAPSGGQDGSLLARVSGGITAVFPSSDYVVRKKEGVVPIVPAGTTFYIGPVPGQEAPRVRRASVLAVDTSVFSQTDTRVTTAPIVWEAEMATPAAALKPTPVASLRLHVMTDEGYRRDRVRRVLGVARGR